MMTAGHARNPGHRRRLMVIAGLAVAVVLSAVIAVAGRSGDSERGQACETPRVAAPSAVAAEARSDISRDGAIAAAVEHATLLSRLLPAEPSTARQMAAEIASKKYRRALVASVDAELLPLQRQLAGLPGSTIHRQSVLATKMDAYASQSSGAMARVSVWVMLTLGQNTAAGGSADVAGQRSNPVASFGTVTLDLVWERDAWRLDGTSQRLGPTPLLEGEPNAADEFVAELDGFADWRPA